MLIMIGCVLGLIAIIAGIKVLSIMRMMASFKPPPPAVVTTAKATYQEWQPELRGVGTLRALRGSDLALDIAGLVTAVNVKSAQSGSAPARSLRIVVRDGSLRGNLEEIVLPDTVGREYLLKLREKASRERERQTKARALSVQVHKLFNPLEEEVSCKKVDADGMLLDIAHLIDTKSIEKYQNRYSTAAKQLKNCQMVVTGPWPPYNFVNIRLKLEPSSPN